MVGEHLESSPCLESRSRCELMQLTCTVFIDFNFFLLCLKQMHEENNEIHHFNDLNIFI